MNFIRLLSFLKRLPRIKYQRKLLSCEKCDYTTRKSRYLKRHFSNMHEDIVKKDPLQVASEKVKTEAKKD